jgi:hypothetical protein
MKSPLQSNSLLAIYSQFFPPNAIIVGDSHSLRSNVTIKSYFMTGGFPPISSFWRKVFWDSRPEISCFDSTFEVIILCNIISDDSIGLSFSIAAGPGQRSHFHIRDSRDSWPHFTVWYPRLPQPGGTGFPSRIHRNVAPMPNNGLFTKNLSPMERVYTAVVYQWMSLLALLLRLSVVKSQYKIYST